MNKEQIVDILKIIASLAAIALEVGNELQNLRGGTPATDRAAKHLHDAHNSLTQAADLGPITGAVVAE